MKPQLSTRLHGLSPRAAIAVLVALLVIGPAVYASVAPHHAKHHGHRSFFIKAKVKRPLRPGTSARVRVKLRNRRRHTLWITRLRVRVSVDRQHRAAGCSARRDFVVRQLPRRVYPIRLPRRRRVGRARWRSFRSLGVHTRPRILMRDLLGVDQDACKGAKLRLRLTGRGRKRRPARHRAGGGLTPLKAGRR